MSPITWPLDPVKVSQGFHSRHGDSALGPLLMWATWTAESLVYLEGVDDVQSNYPASVNGFHPDVIDIAHVRWASSSSVTAVDLCAAALARLLCGWSKEKEADLRSFDPSINPQQSGRLRAQLPEQARAWVDAVLADPRYKTIQVARNPLTHSWLSRIVSRGMNSGSLSHTGRTEFRVGDPKVAVGSRKLVQDSKDLACDHISAFLELIDEL